MTEMGLQMQTLTGAQASLDLSLACQANPKPSGPPEVTPAAPPTRQSTRNCTGRPEWRPALRKGMDSSKRRKVDQSQSQSSSQLGRGRAMDPREAVRAKVRRPAPSRGGREAGRWPAGPAGPAQAPHAVSRGTAGGAAPPRPACRLLPRTWAQPGSHPAACCYFLQARKWATALRDIDNPLADLPAVKRGVRGLLEVCKNGAPPGLAACCCATAARRLRQRCRGPAPTLSRLLSGTWVLDGAVSAAPLPARPPTPLLLALPPAVPLPEENLDDAASEGAVDVVVPLLKKLNGGDMAAQEQPTIRCGAARRSSAQWVWRCACLTAAPVQRASWH